MVDLALPDIFGHVGRAAGHGAADVVVQDVDAAEFIHAGLHQRLDLIGVGDIGRVGDAGAAFIGNHFAGFLSGAGVQIDGKNLRALLGETHGGGLAVAPAGADRAGAGDDGDAIVQASAHVALLRQSSPG